MTPQPDRRGGTLGLGKPLLLIALVSAQPFLALYANDAERSLPASELVLYAIGTTLGATGAYVALHTLLRPRTFRPAALWALLIALCFRYGDVARLWLEAGGDESRQASAWILVVALALGGAFALGARPFFCDFLIAAFALLVAVSGFSIASDRLARIATNARTTEADTRSDAIWSGRAIRTPNIYWIVSDSYPNAVLLENRYAFDNGEFLRSLERRGFTLFRESYANFSSTSLSVSTTLEMDYVVDDGEPYAERVRGVWKMLPSERGRSVADIVGGNNRTLRILRENGYRYVHYEDLKYGLTRCRGFEDICSSSGPAGRSELQKALLDMLPTGLLDALIGPSSGTARAAARIGVGVAGTGIPELGEALATLDAPSPRFVYAHVYAPHLPFTNDAQCTPRNVPLGRTSAERRQAFLDQLTCVNTQLDALIERLVRDDPNAIVALSSDHGPRFTFGPKIDIHALDRPRIRENLAILLALRLPPGCSAPAGPSLTPVNIMRVALACLGGHAPRLKEDRHYISPASPDHPQFGTMRRVDVRGGAASGQVR